MNIQFGTGKTEYGTGVQIDLTSHDVVLAIYAYLVAHDVHVFGAATITINGEMIENGEMYVDPSGFVVSDGIKYSGRGFKE